MPATLATSDRLFDRLWQPGHPFRPRRSTGRRFCMLTLLLLLSGLIGAYWWFTDPVRIRIMAEQYLSQLIGGPVHVGQASLSIFEGLKLTHVTVKVDQSEKPDSLLFVADAFDLQYEPASLLQGRIEATRIIVTGPHVHLVEDVDGGRWNYQRLARPAERGKRTTKPGEPTNPLLLPEIVLRDAEVEYSEIRSGTYATRGMMAMEGRFSPTTDASLYFFELQSRGAVEGVGPVVSGRVRLDTGQTSATLSNFKFGPDIEAMLPSEVRNWWHDHQLQGALNIREFRYTPATNLKAAAFHLETHLEHVQLVVRPQELAGREESARLDRKANAIDLLRRLGLDLSGGATELKQISIPLPIAVEDVSGDFVFEDAGIKMDHVLGTMENNRLAMSGTISGYSPDSPFHFYLGSMPGDVVHLPAHLKYVPSLPADARDIYDMFKPQGDCTVALNIDRGITAGPPRITGEVDVTNMDFICRYFPYPIQGATGKAVVGRKADGGFEQVEFHNVHGHGPRGGVNEHASLTVNGWVGPLDNNAGCDIKVQADNVISDAVVFAAFPQDVRSALEIFREPKPAAPATGPALPVAAVATVDPYAGYPHFRGNFFSEIAMAVGPDTLPTVSTDVTLMDGDGRLAAFPYPLRNLTGTLKIRDGYLDVINVSMKRGDAVLLTDGRVSWPARGAAKKTGVLPDLRIKATNVPIDDDLLNSLPPDKRDWLKKIGVSGVVDAAGRIYAPTDDHRAQAVDARQQVDYAVDLSLHDASVWPIGKTFAATGVGGRFHVTQDRLDIVDLHGQRGDADVFASGWADWSGPQAKVNVNAGARKLALDDSLYKLLPGTARNVWDSMDPHGHLDADLSYIGGFNGEFGASTTQPAAGQYVLTLRPRDLSVTPRSIPYRLDHCSGSVTVKPDGVTLTDISGQHGAVTVNVSGSGSNGGPENWNLALLASDVPVDGDLARAIPPAMQHLISSLGLTGKLTLDFKKFQYRAGPTDDAPPDLDLDGQVRTSSASINVGVPMSNLAGGIRFNASLRAGALDELHGQADFDTFNLAGRPARHLKADLVKPSGQDSLRISNIQGELAGGQFAGAVNLLFPTNGPSSYSLDIMLKNADVSTVGGLGPEIKGQLSASLALEGEWTDLSTRRGRGDVLVTGKQMYQIPLVLGLLEVTNLALPNTSPFSEATARYAVEGQRITFDQIQMRSEALVMEGSGYLDYGTKKVRMNFSTDNPNMPKLPFIHDLWQGAKQELLQIQVRGTVQSPKVSAAALHTFTTTVDEVFTGSGKEK